MAWAFEGAVAQLQKQQLTAKKAGILGDASLVLTTLMAELSEEAGEVTSVSTVGELSAKCGLSYDAVTRNLTKLREKGMIARKQMVKRAGESAYTTVLPAAFAALGLPAPGSEAAGVCATSLPDELRELMCGQSWDVVEAVRKAWHEGVRLPTGVLSEIRGGPAGADRIDRILSQRELQAMDVMERAITEAATLEEVRAAGMDIVKTADGDVMVDVRSFEAACPVTSVRWTWVKDVLRELNDRDARLVTRDNLRDRIAEAAYARVSLPFVKDKAWKDGVRVLAKQMQTSWSKPRKIWDSWYTAADLAVAVIHRQAENG